MKKQSFVIDESDFGLRADTVIAREIPELSRGFIKKLAHEGKLSYRDKEIQAGYKLKSAGTLVLDYDIKELLEVPVLDLPILYEDKDIVVINKPCGVITHSRGRYWDEPSVASSVRKSQAVIDNNVRAGIVHRLDRATSGVILCSKSSEVLAKLQEEFSARRVIKKYVALIQKSDLPDTGLIDKPIDRNPKKPSTFRVDPNGKSAQTKFKVVKRGKQFDMLELAPLTGRTHQLRVHLASLGYPIVGDFLYDGLEADRLFLHAMELTIVIDGKETTFKAPLPKEFKQRLL